MTGIMVPGVPGACEVVTVRAARLTAGHVIRLRHWQGAYTPPDLPYGKVAGDIHGRWREVLSVYPDYDSLAAEYGQAFPRCTHEGCRAWLSDGGDWHGYGPAAHEHAPGPAGQLDGKMAALAEEAFEDCYGRIVIRVLLAEASSSGEIGGVFIHLDKHDLVEAQSLPAERMESVRAGALADGYPAGGQDGEAGAEVSAAETRGGDDDG